LILTANASGSAMPTTTLPWLMLVPIGLPFNVAHHERPKAAENAAVTEADVSSPPARSPDSRR
jgi:hypothetical protein